MAAPLVFKNAFLELNSVNLSVNVGSLALAYSAESLDETTMGDDSRNRKGGLKDWSVDVTFKHNFSCVDATLFGIVGCQACMEIRPQNICSTAVNPRYQGTVHIQSYPPMGGAVGSLLEATVRLESASDLSRNTAAS